MKRRLVILTEIIAPYRTPVFNALAARTEIDLHVIFLAETDPGLRQWQVYRDEIKFSYQVMKSCRLRVGRYNAVLTRGVSAALRANNAEIVICGGYNYPAMWQAQRWARARKIPFLLWSESNSGDARGNLRGIELLKRRFISKCRGYVVPGSSASSYLETFDVSRETIFVAPNAIDVDRFSGAAEKARLEPGLRQRLGLPQRYLLFVGRFVKAKGIFDLLTAYATLPEETRRDVGLVLAGDGEDAEEIRRRGAEIGCGTVVFSGFLQRDELPAVYALAEALVFPTHTDPWGLVVNEALACGLPVIASKVAGCVADLVREGENGFIVAPGDPKALARAMQEILSDPGLQGKMSNCSLQISSQFTPQAWADGVVRAMNSTMGALRG